MITIEDFDAILEFSDGSRVAFSRENEPAPEEPPSADFTKGGIVVMTSSVGQQFPVEVNAIPLNDESVPSSVSNKGHVIPCGTWFPFIELLQTPAAANFVEEPGKWWINTHYTDPHGSDAVSECIVPSGNFLKLGSAIFIPGLGMYHEVLGALPYLYTQYDPDLTNWFNTPWAIHKETARTIDGQMRNIGSNLDVYNPLLKKTARLWIHESYVELFPSVPRTVTYNGVAETITGYIVRGASVWGVGTTKNIPLRLYPSPGNLLEPCPDWHLFSQGVIPESRPEWKFP